MDKLIDEWPIVSVNRIHLGLMVASLLKISEGICRGELLQLDWFSIGRADLDIDVKYGSIDYSNRILLFYSIFAIADLIMYFKHHPFALWALNSVHHVFRIFLLATTVSGSAVCIWQTLCQITYCFSCACLYLKIGLLVDERTPLKWFRRFAKYNFYASIVFRLVGYVFAAYWNFMESFRLYPVRSGLLFSAYFLFDAAYLTFHCLPHPKDDAGSAKDNGQQPLGQVSDSSSKDHGGSLNTRCELNDVLDRELFYPAGDGLIAPLRSLGFTPNLVTLLSGVVQLVGLYLLVTSHFKMAVLSCVFFGYTLDCVDGQMARRYKLVSDLGAALDTGKDAVVHFFFIIALGQLAGARALVPVLLVAFLTVARGGLESRALPFQLCYRIVMLLPCAMHNAALSCHGGVFTLTLMLVILFAV